MLLPRNLPKTTKTLKNIYLSFLKDHVDLCDRYEISYSVFKALCVRFNTLLVERLIFSAYEFPMGSHMGTLRIRAAKTSFTNPKVDYYRSKQLGFRVYHLNDHSNNYYYYTYWRKGSLMNIRSYRFYFNRKNRRLLSQAIREKKVRVR